MSSTATAPSPVSNQVYNAIKALEANFPIPKPSGTYTVGTLDAQSGQFTYAVPTYTTIFNPTGGSRGNPTLVTGGQFTALNVYSVILRFYVTNGAAISASAGGVIQHSAPGNTFVDVNVHTSSSVSFAVTSGNARFASQAALQITRPIAAAGAFTIPVLPIAIVYAPPQGKQKNNTIKYTTSNTIGNLTTTTIGRQDSLTTPVGTQWVWDTDMAGYLRALAPIAKNIPLAGSAVAGALNAIASGLGQASAMATNNIGVTSQHSLLVSSRQGAAIATDPALGGPGLGDIFYVLTNAQVCWFADNGKLSLALLGYDGPSNYSAYELMFLPGNTGLDPNSIQALLALDPFAWGDPQAFLDPARFQLVNKNVHVGGGAPVSPNFGYEVTQSDTQATVNSIVNISVEQSGWLSSLGGGPSTTGATQTTISQSSAASQLNTQATSSFISLNSEADEDYWVDIYCDVVFGTYAVQLVPQAVAPGVVIPNETA